VKAGWRHSTLVGRHKVRGLRGIKVRGIKVIKVRLACARRSPPPLFGQTVRDSLLQTVALSLLPRKPSQAALPQLQQLIPGPIFALTSASTSRCWPVQLA